MNSVPEDREKEISQVLSWLNKNGLEKLDIDRFALCAQARQKHDWTRASELGWQALVQARVSGQAGGNADSVEGWGRMYLGAVYYCQADFAQSLDHFSSATSRFSLDTANQRVAQFACGAAYAGLGNRDGFDRLATPKLVSTLRTMGIQEAEALWKTLESHIGASNNADAVSAVNKTDDPPSDHKQLLSLTRRAIVPIENREEASSLGEQIIMGAIIILIVAACAFVVVRLTGIELALIPYLATWALASYILVKRMKYVVPPGHALVVEKSGVPMVAWGPSTRYCWPFIEHTHALVPLHLMQYASPKKSISLTADEAVDVRIWVYYGVDSAGFNSKNVLSAVYNPQVDMKPSSERKTTNRGKTAPLTVELLRQQWERRLLADLVMTLNEVLPGSTYRSLSGSEVSERTKLLNRLRDQLEQRAHEWGMAIEELNVVELNKAKA